MDKAWSLTLVINGALTVASSEYFTSVLHYSNVALNFDANSSGDSPAVDTGSVSGSFNVEMDNTIPISEGRAGANGSIQSGSDISDPQLSFTRKLTYDSAPELNVDDGNAAQPAGTLDIDGQVTLGGIQYAAYAGPLNGSGTTTLGAPVHLRVNYGVENPTSATVNTEPDDHKIQGSVQVTVNRKLGQITMTETSAVGTDLTARADCAKGQSYTRGTPEQSVNYLFDNDTLAVMIHANLQLKITAPDGSDVTSQYTAQRFMRVWFVPLKPLAAGASPQDSDGSASGRAGALSLGKDWHDDGTGWFDVPGSALSEGAGGFTASRQIEEFLWSAKNNSDLITPIYYIVVTDTRPPHWYRLRVCQRHEVPPDQYTSVRSASGPFKDESDATIFDSHWVNKDIIAGPQ